MRREFPKQAFAAREAHEALCELQKLVDDAAKRIHAAELESFSVAMNRKHDDDIRRTLQNVIDQLESPNFDAMLTTVRERLQTAISS
jgi:hypothetical protein